MKCKATARAILDEELDAHLQARYPGQKINATSRDVASAALAAVIG